MRSYAPYKKNFKKSVVGKTAVVRNRTSNEWDVRIDCDPEYANEIVANLKNAEYILDYCLVSGIELPDHVSAWNAGKTEHHVHIALVFKYQLQRYQVLSTCRGVTARTNEYAVPRNRKFTYAGWFMHHSKTGCKTTGEPAIRYQFGILPEDEVNEPNCNSVKTMLKKFGSNDEESEAANRVLFAKYLVD